MRNEWENRIGAWAGTPGTLRVLRWLAAGAAAVMVLLFLVTALKRLGYPYELEWVEDGNLQELLRVVRHQPIYAAPSVSYVPYLYAPLFFHVAAAMAKLTGAGFKALRMVSILSTLGVFAAIYGLVAGEFPGPRRRQARWLAGIMAVGFFACAYPETGGFFDMGRVDMLCLLLAAGALGAGRKGFPVLAGLLWVASVQTKQGMLPVAVLALCFEWGMPRRIVLGLGTFAAGMLGVLLWMNHATGGWYGRYVFGTARGFPLMPRQLVMFWPNVVLHPFPVVCVLALGGLLLTPPAWRMHGHGTDGQRGRAARFYAMSGLGMVLFTWYVGSHLGASANSALPAFLWFAVVGGIGLGRLYERALNGENARWGRACAGMLLVAAIVQVAMHAYTPSLYKANGDERAQLTYVIDSLRRMPGDVLVMDHPAYASMAGHRGFADGQAAVAVLLRGDAEAQRLRGDYAGLLQSSRLSGVLLDTSVDEQPMNNLWLTPNFARQFPVRVQFGSVAGTHFLTSHPVMLYLPCKAAGGVDARKMFPDQFVDDAACEAR